MPSLSAHLRLPEDHSGLPFHPSCPVCRRDRLAGSLTTDELVSRRTRAAVAAGLLAFSGLGAPVAAASDPDTVTQGTEEPVESLDADSVDIGGDTIEFPDAAPAPPEPALSPMEVEDTAPVEAEGESEALEPMVEATDEAIDDASAAPAEPPEIPEAEPVAAPVVEPPAAETAPQESGIRSEASKRVRIASQRSARKETHAPEPVAVVTQPAPSAVAPATTRVVTGADTGRATSGDRFHTVRRGESLWSIASDVLGEQATVPRIAREVNRLWALNEPRIATGSPDLLYAGTRLRLR